MGVAYQPLPLQADYLEEFGVDLQIDGAVHHVHSDLLHLPGPEDVVALVELGAELHENGNGLPVLLGAHERLHQRRVLPDPVQAYLDALDVRILGRLVDEADDGGERFIGMVEDPVPVPQRLEHVHPLGEFRGHVRLERLLLQLGPVQSDELPEVAESDDVRPVDLEVADLEVPGEESDHVRRHRPLHGHPHRESDVAILEGLLHGRHEVAGLVYGHLDIGVPGYPERVGADDIESWEQRRYVLLQYVLQHHVLLPLGRGHADESGKGPDGDLHPGVELVAALVVHPDGDVQRVVGDERERMAHVQRQRGEEGVDPLLVESRNPGLLVRGEVVHPADYYARVRELRHKALPADRVFGHQPLHDVRHLLQQGVVVYG